MEVNSSSRGDRHALKSGESIDGWLHGRLSTALPRIPKGWQLVYLTSVARLESGHTPSRRRPEYWDGGIPWISLHDSTNLDVPEIQSTALTISSLGLENSSARLLPKGTVVFSRTATVGKATVMGLEMSTSQDFANYICSSRLHNRYLVQLFRFMAPEWKRLMAGSTHNSIYMPIFQDLQILLPPYEEQEAIAEVLSVADALIESLEQLLTKKRQILQGAMQELIAGKRRLPGFRGEWETRELGDLAEIIMGQSPSSRNYNTKGYGLPLIQGNADIVSRRTIKRVFTTEITKKGRSGDILMSVRAPVGEISRAAFDVCLGRGVCAIRCQNDFLYHALIAKEAIWGRTSKGSTFDSVNSTDVKKFAVEIPPSEEEQSAIAAVFSDMNAEINALEAKLAKACEIKQGLMQELLTGRIRLV